VNNRIRIANKFCNLLVAVAMLLMSVPFASAPTVHATEEEGVPGGWMPIVTPPVPDLFSGAATYNYPIAVPPGRNGLQPSVALSYNSRRIDHLKNTESIDSGPVATGWSLGASLMEVTRWNDVVYTGQLRLRDEFSLVLNGTAYALEAVNGYFCGRYLVRGAPR
jgi:hypothetical protein